MSNDFYCRYGEHWAKKEDKIHTARQGNYICTNCEDKRTQNWVKSTLYKRRKDDPVDDLNYED